MDVPRKLLERIDGFDYDYWMNCECGRRSKLTAAVYHERETIDARVPCEHCGGEIHYGSAVTTLRDLEDPALSPDMVNELAWYHTSTYPDWPSPRFEQDTREALESFRHRSFGSFDGVLKMQLTKALHVGSYETAIENILRRMHDEADHNSVFYLHRVALRINEDEISTLRDENQDEASKLLIDDLTELGLRAVRYINVHESPGSVSLAIEPGVIEYVQTIELPTSALAQPAPADVLAAIADIEVELAAAKAAMPDTTGIGERDLRRRTLFCEPGDELASQVNSCEERLRTAWSTLQELLADRYLDGVSPVVRRAFLDAINSGDRGAPRLSATAYHQRFRSHAAALTAGAQVRAVLASQPARVASTKIYPQ